MFRKYETAVEILFFSYRASFLFFFLGFAEVEEDFFSNLLQLSAPLSQTTVELQKGQVLALIVTLQWEM